jgi:hypothetical protein
VPLCGRVDDSVPNALYESIQGSTIYITRWDLMLQGTPLKCVERDDGLLNHISIDTTKMASDFGCTYNSNNCKCKNLWSTDLCLLHSKDDWMMQSFPVDSKVVDKPSFYMLNRDCSKMLEKAMLTQASTNWLAGVLYESQNEFYDNIEALYNTGESPGMVFEDFPKISTWQGQFPPSGEQLQDTADYAAGSKHTLCKISDKERNTREIQGVGSHVSTVIDHTFSAVKNYVSSLGTYVITMQGTDKGYLSSAVCVDSTAMSNFAHAFEQTAKYAQTHRHHFARPRTPTATGIQSIFPLASDRT